MLFISSSDGPVLNDDQIRELDDEFFTARPVGYFTSRILSLLHDFDHTETNPHAAEFLSVLGLRNAENPLAPTKSDRTLQAAIDALSARHHIAEAVVRLLHALTELRTENDPRSTWAALADGPTRLHTVVTQVKARLEAKPGLFSELLFKPPVPDNEGTRLAFDVAVSWVYRAIHLVTSNELTTNAGYNKVKHGLAVRIRDDRRVDIVPGSAMQLDGNGDVRLSSFDASIPIVDKPEIAYLVRPYATPRQGLEVDSLLLDVPVILAETWMMTTVYGAVFHNAAAAHFTGRDEDIEPYPTLPTYPKAADLLDGRIQGFREVITSPPDPSTPPRQSGLFQGNTFQHMDIDLASRRTTTIVE